MIIDNNFKNINNSFLQQHFEDKSKHNFMEIMGIVNNTIELIKDENKFFELCSCNTKEDKISILTSVLLFLGEIKNIISEDINYEELVHKYMIKCKEYIEHNLAYIPMSLYGGLTDLGLSIYSVNKSTGNYGKILNTINNLTLEGVLYRLAQIKHDSKNTKMSDFDVMIGLSGVANYLLIFYEEEHIRKVIVEIIKYFINLTSEVNFLQYNLPNYYVNNENQFTDFDKQMYKKGCFNFSLSHGIAGPMLIMSKALKLGIELKGQKDAIELMLDDIIEYSYVNNLGYRQFTGRISLEKYLNKDMDMLNSRASWCYGAPGIGKAIYIACDIIKNNEAKEVADSSLEFLVKYPDKWELNSPTICHGLAGLLAYFESIFVDNNNSEMLLQINNITETLINMYDNSSYFGYRDINVKENEDGKYTPLIEDKIGFLSGTIGVTLVLLNALNFNKPIWMKKILID